MSFFKSFEDSLKKSYPDTFARFGGAPPLSPYQVSPHVLSLPAALKHVIQNGIRSYWKYVRQRPIHPPHGVKRSELGVCSSFDFHVNENQAKLIEVNTNASLSLVFPALEKFHGLTPEDPRPRLVESFLQEHSLASGTSNKPQIAIVDKDVAAQKMRLEFYLYQELFQAAGLHSEVIDLKQLEWDAQNLRLTSGGKSSDLVYNRHTDFHFAGPESAQLLAAYQSGKVTITPNPYNYELLANKSILCDLTQELAEGAKSLTPEEATSLREILLPTYWAKDMDTDELWARRKEFFFKPATSFGSKGVYKGKSISQKIFEVIRTGNYLAQQIFPPDVITTESGEFKYDVRIITYGDEILTAGARLYAGQLTNFQTLGGGAAPVIWS